MTEVILSQEAFKFILATIKTTKQLTFVAEKGRVSVTTIDRARVKAVFTTLPATINPPDATVKLYFMDLDFPQQRIKIFEKFMKHDQVIFQIHNVNERDLDVDVTVVGRNELYSFKYKLIASVFDGEPLKQPELEYNNMIEIGKEDVNKLIQIARVFGGYDYIMFNGSNDQLQMRGLNEWDKDVSVEADLHKLFKANITEEVNAKYPATILKDVNTITKMLKPDKVTIEFSNQMPMRITFHNSYTPLILLVAPRTD